MEARLKALLASWGDGMVRYRVEHPGTPGLHGAILCPACQLIHGRSADAAYPLLALAGETGDRRYLDAAVDLVAWSDSVSATDGSFLNDSSQPWKGITVFGAAALAESLIHHGDQLPEPVRERWLDRLRRAMGWLDANLTIDTGNINYPVVGTVTFLLGARALGEPAYEQRAAALMAQVRKWFTPVEGLLFGEGKEASASGLQPVDLGYNVEESLPALARYAALTGDPDALELALDTYRAHLPFMLPDGAWDNSWGTRNFKWTYWGSRTSDGCLAGLLLMARHDPVFAEAASRHLSLLEACTHDGILHGGPHLHSHGVEPCVFHTMMHAKDAAAALALLAETLPPAAPRRLPRDHGNGLKRYQDLATWLIAQGAWRATVTAYDAPYYGKTDGHASGGTLSMLWHADAGPVLTASNGVYRLIEPTNMQWSREWSDHGQLPPLTPRLEAVIDGVRYASMFNQTPVIGCLRRADVISVRVRGRLADANQQDPASGPIPFTMSYHFDGESVRIRAQLESEIPVFLCLPVISPTGETVSQPAPDTVVVEKPAGRLVITLSDAPSAVSGERLFHFVPGLEAVDLRVPVSCVCTARFTFETD